MSKKILNRTLIGIQKYKSCKLISILPAILCFLLLSCKQQADIYTIINKSGHNVTVMVNIDGKIQKEFFSKDDTIERTFLFAASAKAELVFEPPTPCYLEQKGYKVYIKEAASIEAAVINTTGKPIKIGAADFRLTDRESLLQDAIFDDCLIPADSTGNKSIKIKIKFYQLTKDPSYCSKVKIYTNSDTAAAYFTHNGKQIPPFQIELKTVKKPLIIN